MINDKCSTNNCLRWLGRFIQILSLIEKQCQGKSNTNGLYEVIQGHILIHVIVA